MEGGVECHLHARGAFVTCVGTVEQYLRQPLRLPCPPCFRLCHAVCA
jgi:hypothetical protein